MADQEVVAAEALSVEGPALAAPVSPEETPQPQPTRTEDELRRLQSAKDREISSVLQQNRDLAARLEAMERSQEEAHIRSMEDPEERAKATIALGHKELARMEEQLRQEREIYAYPVVLVTISQKYGVPVEVLQGATSAPDMEKRALKYKLDTLGKELEAERKKAGKPSPPAAVGQKFAQGEGTPPSGYDPKKFEGTGDIAGSLRAKKAAGL